MLGVTYIIVTHSAVPRAVLIGTKPHANMRLELYNLNIATKYSHTYSLSERSGSKVARKVDFESP